VVAQKSANRLLAVKAEFGGAGNLNIGN